MISCSTNCANKTDRYRTGIKIHQCNFPFKKIFVNVFSTTDKPIYTFTDLAMVHHEFWEARNLRSNLPKTGPIINCPRFNGCHIPIFRNMKLDFDVSSKNSTRFDPTVLFTIHCHLWCNRDFATAKITSEHHFKLKLQVCIQKSLSDLIHSK